jgi:uncharacterized membrane protein YtjA (UPF0391 family)
VTIGRKWRQQVVAARDKSHFAQARLVLPTRTLKEERNNASYAIVFFVIAIIAAIFGFSGIAGTGAWIAQILFVVFLVLFVVSLITGRRPPAS